MNGLGFPVSGATATLTSLDVPGLAYTVAGDANGLVQFGKVPAGNYAYAVQSPGFQANSGNVTIEPGLNKSLEVPMITATVTYTWSVTPTSIIDKYNVTLQAQFKTDVPAPVVVLNPISVGIQAVVGSPTYGQFTITNYGLISALNVQVQPNSPDGAVQIDLPVTMIPELKAGQSVVIPYKLTLLHSSPCHPAQFIVTFCYKCALGLVFNGKCDPLQIAIGTGVECYGGAVDIVPQAQFRTIVAFLAVASLLYAAFGWAVKALLKHACASPCPQDNPPVHDAQGHCQHTCSDGSTQMGDCQ